MLQENFGLYGARESCGQGMCGCCTVLVDGRAVRCLYLGSLIEGAEVLPWKRTEADAVQQAFVEASAFQCGFCTPGFVLMTRQLLDEHPDPDEDTIKHYLSGNLCRCAAYRKSSRRLSSPHANGGMHEGFRCVVLLLGSSLCIRRITPTSRFACWCRSRPAARSTRRRASSRRRCSSVNWQFVVENRPGGNGFIATTAAAKSAPDGYTLLAHTGEFAVNPALFDNVPYDLERDFVAITMVSDAPMLYLATAKAPFSTFQELVAQAKAKPGSITYGSAGNGSINHPRG